MPGDENNNANFEDDTKEKIKNVKDTQSEKLREYKKIEKDMRITFDDPDFPQELKTIALDYINVKTSNGNKRYHSLTSMKKFRENVKNQLKEEKLKNNPFLDQR